ncbi:hypothetical protein [Bradyrhizobium sp. S69]|uniref:hypothetical protein n=1 Tax=Bradyrhizobium sp. S69 TaxID=1641856 RepID=UPI001FEDE562|nr:hypothetical protein [Bradyrhizobium sp. S69]
MIAAPMLGQQRDIDHAVLGIAAIEIEPSDRFAGAQHDEPRGVRIVALIFGVLRLELHGQERRLLRVGPRHRRKLLGAGRRIDPIQKRQTRRSVANSWL